MMRQSVRIMKQCVAKLRAPDGQGPPHLIDSKIVPPRRAEMKRSMEAGTRARESCICTAG
jgi:NADH-quinone oxidoreductase subunit D